MSKSFCHLLFVKLVFILMRDFQCSNDMFVAVNYVNTIHPVWRFEKNWVV